MPPLGADIALDESQLGGKEIVLSDSATMQLDKLDLALESWKGDSADDYRRHQIELRQALAGCQDRIASAWRVMVKYKETVENYRKDILALIEAVYEAFEAAGTVDKQVELNTLAGLVTGAAALIVAPFTAGASAVAWLGVGATLTSTAIATGLTNKSLRVGATNEAEAVLELVEKGKELVRDARKAAAVLGEASYTITKHLTGEWLDVTDENPNGVRASRPDIVTDDKFTPSEFRPEDRGPNDLKGIDTDDLVKEPPKDPDQERDHQVKPPGFFERLGDELLNPGGRDVYEEQGPDRDGSTDKDKVAS